MSEDKGNEESVAEHFDWGKKVEVATDVFLEILNSPERPPVDPDDEGGDDIPEMSLENFSATCREYFISVSKIPPKIEKSQRGVEINRVQMPFTLDGLCLRLGLTKREFILYTRKGSRFRRVVEMCVMLINDHMITQGLISNYDRQVVWNVIKNNDGFYKDRIIGKENTPDNMEEGGGDHNVNLIVVNNQSDLSKLKMDEEGRIIDVNPSGGDKGKSKNKGGVKSLPAEAKGSKGKRGTS